MQVTQTNADGLKYEFKVVVPAGHISELVENRLNEVSQTIRMPGFRPGKVPMGLLRKKYGTAVTGEVVEAAVNDGARHALDEHKVRPAVQPKVEITKFAEGDDLEFTVAVEALPEVKVAELSDIQIERPVAEVSGEEISGALANIAARNDRDEPAPEGHAAASGDIVMIDFEGSIDGEVFEGGKAEGHRLALGSGSFIPGFEDQLIGAKAGDDRVVKVAFPEDYGHKPLAGKNAEFAVKVHEVRQKVAAEVNDDLAKQLGLADAEALKNAVKEEITQQHNVWSRAHAKRRLLDKLADAHDFTVPEGMVDVEFNAIWQQIERDRAAGQKDPSDEGKDDETLKAEYRAIAERRVLLGLVLSEIGTKNNITVTQADLNRAMIAEARRYPGQEQQVMQYFQKNQQALDSLRAPIFEEKVVDYILEMAKVADKNVSLEELMGDPDATAPDESESKKGKAKAKSGGKTAAKAKEAASSDDTNAEAAAEDKPKAAAKPKRKKSVTEE